MDPAAKKHTTDFEKEKQLIREFFENYYVESENGTKVFKYREQIVKLAEREEVVLNLNLSDLASYEPGLEQAVHENAARYHNLFIEVAQSMIEEYLGDRQPPVRDALDAFIFQRVYMDRTTREANAGNTAATEDVRKKYPPQLLRRFEVSMKSQDTDKTLSVRQINAHYVGKLVTVGGIVIRATEVRPMASVITYACDTCGAEAYQPVSGPSFTPAVNCPSKDCIESRANGRLHMQIRGSKFVKFQEIKIQETSDQVPVGSIPRTVTINVYGENTRKCQPGDLVRVTGVLIPMLKSSFRQAGGGLVTDTYIEAFYVENTLNSEEGLLNLEEELTDEEIERISQGNFYEQLAYSIAPEIYGHTDVKKSLLLALIGGVDKNAEGMKIRGCLNVLLMGDPGVAKSQLLSYVDRLAPRSQYTTGRGSSGVGLTAAVVKDSLTGEMTLEGGALVLADKGVCCIDEFDKMVDSDRTAIHEVMEQQTISIAKAGIMTTLNARVAIVAAANPAFGRYNPKKSIEQNIDLPAALLSRFDMLWLIQDKVDRDSDRRLAEHITYVHQHGQQPDKDGLDVLPMALVRKYIAICKRKNPVVDQKLRERLVELYVEMRKSARDNESSTFTSPRMLLSVIRLREVVTEEDIEEAIRLTLAAKDSLRADQARQSTRQAPVDAAFSVLREIYQNQGDNEPINMQTAVQRCARKGISEQVLNECIESHVATGVLVLDRQKRIVFAMN